MAILEKEGDVERLARHLHWTRDSVLLGEGLSKDGFEQILTLLQSPGLLCSTFVGLFLSVVIAFLFWGLRTKKFYILY